MKRLTWAAPELFIGIMLGGVGISQAGGAWVATGRETVAVGQQLAVDDIKGWMTLQQAADASRLDVGRLVAEAGLPADVDPDVTLRELVAARPGFEIQTVRDAVERLR